MIRGAVRTGRLRRRLTVTFILAAALSAGALAVISFILVYQTRLNDSLARAERQARVDLLLATGLRFGESATEPQQFLLGFAQRRVDAVLVAGATQHASNPRRNPPIPSDLRRLVGESQLAYRRIDHAGDPYLVIGGRPARSDVELYFVHSESQLRRDLRTLGVVLLGGWAGLTLLAGLAGRALARRTLGPVAEASRAARSIAEGLLATRLPVESNDEFGNWASSFNEMADALEAKIAALSEAEARERRFTADVSHELRTPITALVGAAALLREHLDRMPGEARRPAELVIGDIARLRRLVDELMEMSRLDAGSERVHVEEVRVAPFIEALLRARGWSALVTLAGDGLRLSTDPRRLERILDNLIGNALTHGGRDVSVHVRLASGVAIVEVADRGPGIEPEHLPRVFDRFYKADPARTRTGSGLGLAIARENARLLGGDIDAWSEPGHGARFTLRLPVTEPLHDGDILVTGESEHEVRETEKGGGT